MESRNIKTKLIGKDELFKVIALSEATKKPILLVGEPGVGKTQCLIDYASAMYNYDKDKAREKCFVLELDEGTKSSEIKGRVNMEDLLVNKKYKIDAPIADAEYILINEVDKGSSAVRNTMLSVMREKALFLGSEIKECNWKLFAGSCNIIPEDELENPFWDRFIIQYTVERVRANDIYSKIWNDKSTDIKVDVPNEEEISKMSINAHMMKIFLKTVYKNISDRTAVTLPELTKGIKIIWKLADAEAIMKACELVSPHKVAELSQKLEDPAIVSIKTKIKGISEVGSTDLLIQHINQIENEIDQLGINPHYTEKVQELTYILKDTMSKDEGCQRMVEEMKSKLNS